MQRLKPSKLLLLEAKPGEGLGAVQQGLQGRCHGSNGSDLVPSRGRRLHCCRVALELLKEAGNQCFQHHQHLKANQRPASGSAVGNQRRCGFSLPPEGLGRIGDHCHTQLDGLTDGEGQIFIAVAEVWRDREQKVGHSMTGNGLLARPAQGNSGLHGNTPELSKLYHPQVSLQGRKG